MDEAQFELVRKWGEGLAANARDELQAAGRAIVMLADEIERLNREFWKLKDEVAAARAESEPPMEPTLAADLRRRLRAFIRR